MTGWIVFACILLVLFLIGLIPVGVDAAWEESLRIAIRIWFLNLRLGGKEKKESKPEEEKEENKPEAGKEKKKMPLSLIKRLVSRGYSTLCRLLSRLRVELLKIHFTSAFPDPADTAAWYAAAGVALEGLQRVGGKRILHTDLRAMADFDSDKPLLFFQIRLTIRIFRILGLGLGFGFGLLIDFLKYKKEVASHG